MQHRGEEQPQGQHPDRHDGITVTRIGGPEHEAREQGRPAPEDQHGPAVAVAQAQQAVVQMVLVR